MADAVLAATTESGSAVVAEPNSSGQVDPGDFGGNGHARARWQQTRGVVRAAETLRHTLVTHRPQIVAVLQGVFEAQRWFEEAPGKLTDALATSGWLLHPDLSVPDYRRVTNAFDTSGADAAATLAGVLNMELFEDETFQYEIRQRWSRSTRVLVLEDIWRSFELGLYSVTVPAALAQCEGLIASLSNHKGQMKQNEMLKYAKDAFSDDPFMTGPVEKLLAVLTAHFQHGGPVPKPLSRHAILHGADFSYGTKENAVRSLVWLDVLIACDLERSTAVGSSNSASEP